MTKKLITISVDDGHPFDFKTAELLSKYGFKATFYIPKNNPEREVINENQIKEISQQFEIGAHTLSHLPLHKMNDDQAYKEISESKIWLENLLSKPCISFCYPQGKFNRQTPKLVEKALFLGARNCYFNRLELKQKPFYVGVSTHAYSHSMHIQIRHALIENNITGAIQYFSKLKAKKLWNEHFLESVKYVSKNGGIAHLFLHSWEIDSTGQWDILEQTLKMAKNYYLESITNGQHFEMIRSLD